MKPRMLWVTFCFGLMMMNGTLAGLNLATDDLLLCGLNILAGLLMLLNIGYWIDDEGAQP